MRNISSSFAVSSGRQGLFRIAGRITGVFHVVQPLSQAAVRRGWVGYEWVNSRGSRALGSDRRTIVTRGRHEDCARPLVSSLSARIRCRSTQATLAGRAGDQTLARSERSRSHFDLR